MAGRIRRMWDALRRPPVRMSLGAVLIIGAVSAWVAWGSFVYVIEETSTNNFCANACHEMNISFAEYSKSIHGHNRTGVTATCADCHIPHTMVKKVIRKTEAGFTDVMGKISGVIDTPEKFEAHRMAMAEKVWADMKKNDSRECRFCHDRKKMDAEQQGSMAQRKHATAVEQGKTCIDCHQGVAHNLPEEPEPAPAPDTTAPPAEGSAAPDAATPPTPQT